MDRQTNIEWMYVDACVQARKADVAAGEMTKGPWFQLADMLEALYPTEVAMVKAKYLRPETAVLTTPPLPAAVSDSER